MNDIDLDPSNDEEEGCSKRIMKNVFAKSQSIIDYSGKSSKFIKEKPMKILLYPADQSYHHQY